MTEYFTFNLSFYAFVNYPGMFPIQTMFKLEHTLEMILMMRQPKVWN